VITDHPDGAREFVVDAKTAEQLSTEPTPVVETKALRSANPLRGHGGRLEGMYGQRIGRRKPEPKPSDVFRIHPARKKRLSDSLYKRFAKSAIIEDQKAALVDALTDENARSVHLSVKTLAALIDIDLDDEERDLLREMMNYVAFTQKTVRALLIEHKAVSELPELIAAISDYKRASESVIEGLRAELTERHVSLDVITNPDGSQVLVVDDPTREIQYRAIPNPAIELGKAAAPIVPRGPLSLTNKEIDAIAEKAIAAHRGLTNTGVQERGVIKAEPSLEAAEYVIRRHADAKGKK
jgi:hypothetical protein